MGVVFLSALTYLLVRLGVVTQTGKNFMLDALFRNTLGAADVTHVGLFDFDNGRNITGETVDDNIDDVATPYANNDIIIFTAKTGGSNIVLLKPYYVINKAANLFQISEVQGGAAVDFGSDLTATTTIRRLTEISGGSPAYARKAIAFNAATLGSIDDSTSPVFDIPAGAVVDGVGFYDQLAVGGTLQAFDDLTSESFAGQGTYTLSDSDIDLNA
jgi:hypothetical protein